MTRSARELARHCRQTTKGPLILLFYDGYERPAREGFLGGAYSQLRRFVRYGYRSARRRQVRTGFYTAFLGLVEALRRAGCDVRINDFGTARAMPNYPIGIAGYPSVLDHVALPNPTIFGPGDYGAPDTAPLVAARPSIRVLIQPSDWFADYYRASCGDKMAVWFAGIDTDRWRDASDECKTTDVLIYDKIRWHRQTFVPALLERLTAHLDSLGLSHRTVRYGHHHQKQFRAECERARTLAFLCEHETQGLAYQEAMAMNLPVFAWDEGVHVDPYMRQFGADPPGISSVPYFDERCGARFTIDTLESEFARFWAARERYRPRAYVCEKLSMATSAAAYLQIYDALAPGTTASTPGEPY